MRRPRTSLSLVAALLLAPLVVASGASAASSVCGPGKTALGGSLQGSDGSALNATVNVELTNADTTRAYDVYTDGRVDTVGHPAGSRYSYTDNVNPDLEARRFADRRTRLDRTWGAPRTATALCFTSNARIAQAYIEIYPRRGVDSNGDGHVDRQVTDRSRYGGAAHYRQPVRSGQSNTGIVLRLPQNVPSQVGAVVGYATYRNRAVPVAAPGCGSSGRPACNGITTVRAFPKDTIGAHCGIEGFSASADGLDPSARGGAATYYRIGALAGGRCGAATQSYDVRMTCVSFCGRSTTGSASRTVAAAPAVQSGGQVQADLHF